MATKTLVPFLVAMMLVTGVCNTLLTKLQVGARSSSFLSLSVSPRPILLSLRLD